MEVQKMGMRGGMGHMQKMMKQMQNMQKKMAEAQEELGEKKIEGTAGGGMVTVIVTGHKEIVEVTIKPEVVDPDDIEMLQHASWRGASSASPPPRRCAPCRRSCSRSTARSSTTSSRAPARGKVSFTHLIVFAVLRALATFPALNSAYGVEDGKPVVVRHEHVNLGLAVDVQKSRRHAHAARAERQGRRHARLRGFLRRVRRAHRARSAATRSPPTTSPAPPRRSRTRA